MGNDVILVLVVITALAFDFTNGFHDTGNAMATSIATGALSPRLAVALSGVLNLVGAFLSLAVAATIASGLVDTKVVTLTVVAAGLTGGIIWNLLTWLLGIPSSSSHALIGGVIGATLAAAGGTAVLWHGLVSKVILPAALSPVIAGLVARSVPGCSTGSAAALPRRAGCTVSAPGRLGRRAWFPGPRHQRRAEDDGRHHAGPDRERDAGRRVHRAVLGHPVLRDRHQPRYLHRRLAGHPHPGQGPGRDRIAAGHGGRVLSALWKIVVFGVLAGAGLPALFAIGLRALALPGSRVQTAGADSDHVYGGNVLGLVIAALCFLIILAAIGWGIYEVYQIGHPPAKH